MNDQALQDIESAARKPGERQWVQETVPALVAEIRRLHAKLADCAGCIDSAGVIVAPNRLVKLLERPNG